MVIRRGEVWWAELAAPVGPRPVVVLSRDEACAVRSHLIVAPVTTRIRGLPVEVGLGPADGLPRVCVVNVDALATVAKTLLVERLTALHPGKLSEVDRALKFALAVT